MHTLDELNVTPLSLCIPRPISLSNSSSLSSNFAPSSSSLSPSLPSLPFSPLLSLLSPLLILSLLIYKAAWWVLLNCHHHAICPLITTSSPRLNLHYLIFATFGNRTEFPVKALPFPHPFTDSVLAVACPRFSFAFIRIQVFCKL